MKIITIPTHQQKEQLNISIQSAKEYINAYKQHPDTELLKKKLCEVIDVSPNIAYLDPDLLSCYDIEVDDSEWVELDEYEMEMNNSSLKEVVNDIDEFQSHQLSFMSSGSILRTIFGDAYDEVGNL